MSDLRSISRPAAAVLCTIVLIFCFSACTGEIIDITPEPTAEDTSAPAETAVPTEAPTPTAEPTPTPEPSPTEDPDKERDALTPVIVIPGLFGSELSIAGNPYAIIWPPVDVTSVNENASPEDSALSLSSALANIANLTLSPDMTEQIDLSPISYSPVSEALASGANIGSLDTYRPLVTALSERIGSDNVYFYGYDFRFTSDMAADGLAELVDEICADKNVSKVDLIGHSMGGTVALSYMEKYGVGKVDTFVPVGAPFSGSDNATYAVTAPEQMLLEMTDGILGGALSALSGETDITQIMSLISDPAISFVSSMPSIYMLIPPESFDPVTMDSAAAFYGRSSREKMGTAAPIVFSSVKIVNVVGTESPTVVKTEEGFSASSNGDGTVTLYSATAEGLLYKYIKEFPGVSHGDLVISGDCLAYITDALAD